MRHECVDGNEAAAAVAYALSELVTLLSSSVSAASSALPISLSVSSRGGQPRCRSTPPASG
jgi:hypothetical protein